RTASATPSATPAESRPSGSVVDAIARVTQALRLGLTQLDGGQLSVDLLIGRDDGREVLAAPRLFSPSTHARRPQPIEVLVGLTLDRFADPFEASRPLGLEVLDGDLGMDGHLLDEANDLLSRRCSARHEPRLGSDHRENVDKVELLLDHIVVDANPSAELDTEL